MRRRAGWMAGLMVAALVACDPGGAPTGPEGARSLVPGPVEVVLPLGREVEVGGGPLRLVFTRIVQDSRCPVDATCVWAGNAVVEVAATLGTGPAVPLRLNGTLEPRSVRWNGLRMTFLELLPLPVSEGPPPSEPTLRLRLERDG